MVFLHRTTDCKCAAASVSLFLFSLSCESFSSTIRSYWLWKRGKATAEVATALFGWITSAGERRADLVLFHQRHHVCDLVLTLERRLVLVFDGFCFRPPESVHLLSPMHSRSMCWSVKKWDQFVSRCVGDLFDELRDHFRLGLELVGQFDMVLLVEPSEVLNLHLEAVDLNTGFSTEPVPVNVFISHE